MVTKMPSKYDLDASSQCAEAGPRFFEKKATSCLETVLNIHTKSDREVANPAINAGVSVRIKFKLIISKFAMFLFHMVKMFSTVSKSSCGLLFYFGTNKWPKKMIITTTHKYN